MCSLVLRCKWFAVRNGWERDAFKIHKYSAHPSIYLIQQYLPTRYLLALWQLSIVTITILFSRCFVFLLLSNPLENRLLKQVSLFPSLGHVMILERTFSLTFVIFTYTCTHLVQNLVQKIEVKLLWEQKRQLYPRTTNWNDARTVRCL